MDVDDSILFRYILCSSRKILLFLKYSLFLDEIRRLTIGIDLISRVFHDRREFEMEIGDELQSGMRAMEGEAVLEMIIREEGAGRDRVNGAMYLNLGKLQGIQFFSPFTFSILLYCTICAFY